MLSTVQSINPNMDHIFTDQTVLAYRGLPENDETLAAFRDRQSADAFVERLKAVGIQPTIFSMARSFYGVTFRVD